MAKEYFWGIKLSDKAKTVKWDPEADLDDDDDDDDDAIEHFLFLKQAVLGSEAKDEKRNVIEVETVNFDGDIVSQPLLSLKLGLNESACLDIGLQPPVTFKLACGSGPVYLSGQHALDLQDDPLDDDNEDIDDLKKEDFLVDDDDDLETTPEVTKSKSKVASAKKDTKETKKLKEIKKEEEEDDEDEDEDEDDDDEDDEEDEEEEEVEEKAVNVSKGKKRPAPSSTGGAKKLAKVDKEGKKITNGVMQNGDAHEDEDDDDEDDESFKVEDEEDDDDDDDDDEEEEDEEMALEAGDDEDESDEEDMDDDDEEDDDEDEEEEEDSSPAKPLPKKAKGKVNGVKKSESQKDKAKGTPKGKEGKENKKTYTIEEMKKELAKSPSKPKKEAKFSNFVKSRFQLTEKKTIQELWGWYKSAHLK